MPLNTEVLRSNQDAFGMLMPSRTYQAAGVEGYRFGFNGKEEESEVSEKGNTIAFEARIYDARLDVTSQLTLGSINMLGKPHTHTIGIHQLYRLIFLVKEGEVTILKIFLLKILEVLE